MHAPVESKPGSEPGGLSGESGNKGLTSEDREGLVPTMSNVRVSCMHKRGQCVCGPWGGEGMLESRALYLLFGSLLSPGRMSGVGEKPRVLNSEISKPGTNVYVPAFQHHCSIFI